MKRRSFPVAFVILSFVLLIAIPLNASGSLGWEGVSFGLVLNEKVDELTTIYFVDLNDSLVDSIDINNERTINEPQFRMVVNTNVRNSNVRITLRFEPFSMELAGKNYQIPYTVRMYDEDGYTPMQFDKGTSTVDKVSIDGELNVSFTSGVSPDGSTWSFEYPFSFEFEKTSLSSTPAGNYSCNLIAEIVST